MQILVLKANLSLNFAKSSLSSLSLNDAFIKWRVYYTRRLKRICWKDLIDSCIKVLFLCACRWTDWINFYSISDRESIRCSSSRWSTSVISIIIIIIIASTAFYIISCDKCMKSRPLIFRKSMVQSVDDKQCDEFTKFCKRVSFLCEILMRNLWTRFYLCIYLFMISPIKPKTGFADIVVVEEVQGLDEAELRYQTVVKFRSWEVKGHYSPSQVSRTVYTQDFVVFESYLNTNLEANIEAVM